VRSAPVIVHTTPRQGGSRRGYSSHQLLDSAPWSFLSRPYSTVLPSPKRYDERYEDTFLKNIRPH
jgi:hypothetical protein